QDLAPLPPTYADVLDPGLEALGLALSPEAREAIDVHVRLLLAWTEAINLTAIREPGAVALAHVVDSLTAVPLLRERATDRFVDIGSGGGYPGLPLAAALPAARALLAEPIGKKAGFLGTVIAAVGLGGIAEAAMVRAEVLARDARHRGRWPAVTARAVASMADLVELAFPLLAPGGILIAWKRGDLAVELAAAERAVDALGGGRLDLRPVHVPGLENHRLVVATVGGRVPPAYPRDPGTRKRRPW
ncbi:MAG: 16S rRNA (guanine(527)-N(7))-methyltransferase RsmG, partial [Candidatus Limnocylindrales bacterium]